MPPPLKNKKRKQFHKLLPLTFCAAVARVTVGAEGIGYFPVVGQQNLRAAEGFRSIQLQGLVGEVADHRQALLFRIPGVGEDMGILRQQQGEAAVPEHGISLPQFNEFPVMVEYGIAVFQGSFRIDSGIVGIHGTAPGDSRGAWGRCWKSAGRHPCRSGR